MSAPAIACLRALGLADFATLIPGLNGRLNRPAEPPVSMTLVDGVLAFRAETWQPILLARVEDALDELLGSEWRAGFTLT
jgi:hypothetical protein